MLYNTKYTKNFYRTKITRYPVSFGPNIHLVYNLSLCRWFSDCFAADLPESCLER